MTPGPRVHTAIDDTPLSVAEAHSFVGDPSAGATVVFTGTVRNRSEGREVAGLSYEAYRERAAPQLAALAGRAARRWPALCAIWMTHRTGSLAIGEPAVVVAVSAPHRAEAFAAAAWGIDTLKAEVAIWKQEHWADGAAHWPGTD